MSTENSKIDINEQTISSDLMEPLESVRKTTMEEDFAELYGEEIGSLRGISRKVFDLGKGRRQAISYSEPVHYVVPGWIHSKIERLYSFVIVFILACFLVNGGVAMADTQYYYTSQRVGLSPIVSDGLHVFLCDIQKHILTTECTVYDVSRGNKKQVFTKTGNLFWIACGKNQALLTVGYSGGILE